MTLPFIASLKVAEIDGSMKSRLRAELRLRQGRLGTPAEQADDHDLACAIAHLLNNCATIEALGGPARPFEHAP